MKTRSFSPILIPVSRIFTVKEGQWCSDRRQQEYQLHHKWYITTQQSCLIFRCLPLQQDFRWKAEKVFALSDNNMTRYTEIPRCHDHSVSKDLWMHFYKRHIPSASWQAPPCSVFLYQGWLTPSSHCHMTDTADGLIDISAQGPGLNLTVSFSTMSGITCDILWDQWNKSNLFPWAQEHGVTAVPFSGWPFVSDRLSSHHKLGQQNPCPVS